LQLNGLHGLWHNFILGDMFTEGEARDSYCVLVLVMVFIEFNSIRFQRAGVATLVTVGWRLRKLMMH
jgi:hypothetical protein